MLRTSRYMCYRTFNLYRQYCTCTCISNLGGWGVMVFNATLNNISVISWYVTLDERCQSRSNQRSVGIYSTSSDQNILYLVISYDTCVHQYM